MCTGHGQFLISILIDDVTFCKAVKAVMLELKSASEWHGHALVHFYASAVRRYESHFHHRSGGEESTFLTSRQV